MAVKKNILKKTAKKKDDPYDSELAKYEGQDNSANERGDKSMSIVGHLSELRSRLIVSLISITIVTFAGFLLFSDYILAIINRPFLETGLKLSVFSLSEGFIIRAKAALIAGILICFPVIIYEIWRYIVPAIGKKERKFIGCSVVASVLLMYTGILLTYFFLLPIAIKMLLSFTPENMNNIIEAGKYLSFVFLFCLAIGFMCELPIFIMILTKVGIITPKILIKKRKYAVVLIWIFAAILTPGPDVLSQALVAVPIMLLYEISIIISKIIVKRKT